MKTPHWLRFAQSLALGAGFTSALAGCASSTSPAPDVAQADTAAPSDVATDTTVSSDANPCASCQCVGIVPPDVQTSDSGVPACTGEQLGMCCAAVGPLPPPELSA